MKTDKTRNKNTFSKQTKARVINHYPEIAQCSGSVIPGGCFPMSLYGGIGNEASRLLREGKSEEEVRAILDAIVSERARALAKTKEFLEAIERVDSKYGISAQVTNFSD